MTTIQATGDRTAIRIPDELLGSLPRHVRLTGWGIALAVLSVAMAAAALAAAILLSILYQQQDRQRQIRQRDGVAIQAEVVNVRLQGGDHPRRIVTYRYEVTGRLYSGAVSFGRKERLDITEGRLIPVAYVPLEPHASWMVGHEPKVFPLILIPLISIGLLAGAGAMALGLRRQWNLLSEGRPALATVLDHKKVHRDKHSVYRITYEFHTLNGARKTGAFDVGSKPPAVGTILPIVYHRDNPGRAAKYPLSLVRPARLAHRVR